MSKDIMSKVLEVSTFEHGTFKQKGSEREVPFARVYGRDQHSRFVNGVAYGPPAAALVAKVQQLLPEGQNASTYGFVVEVQGAIRVREDQKESFVISRFNFVTGPSVELHRSKVAAGRAIDAAREALAVGDLAKAYRLLEENAASFAQVPAPSVDHGMVLGSKSIAADIATSGVEEAAAGRLAELDARRSAAAPVGSTPVADAAAHTTVPESAAPEVADAEALDADRAAAGVEPEMQAEPVVAAPVEEFGIEAEPAAEAQADAAAEAAPVAEPAVPEVTRPAARPMVRPILTRGMRRPPMVPGGPGSGM